MCELRVFAINNMIVVKCFYVVLFSLASFVLRIMVVIAGHCQRRRTPDGIRCRPISNLLYEIFFIRTTNGKLVDEVVELMS